MIDLSADEKKGQVNKKRINKSLSMRVKQEIEEKKAAEQLEAAANAAASQ